MILLSNTSGTVKSNLSSPSKVLKLAESLKRPLSVTVLTSIWLTSGFKQAKLLWIRSVKASDSQTTGYAQ